MSKAKRIAKMMAGADGTGLDPHYTKYFELFNLGQFYEAHDVLEQIWLPQRHGTNGNFFKGLIQLAGAFVHLQKNRPGPAAALFGLAQANLLLYPPQHESLDISKVLELIGGWQRRLEEPGGNLLTEETRPRLALPTAQAQKA